MDIFDREKRSEIMGRIRGRNTNPEIKVRSLLHRLGFRFRLFSRKLPGHPDIVLPRWRCVIFVHGCYWHRHPGCKVSSRLPETNREFWAAKFARNVERDGKTKEALQALGWRVLIVWECETGKRNLEALGRRLLAEITDKRTGDASDD